MDRGPCPRARGLVGERNDIAPFSQDTRNNPGASSSIEDLEPQTSLVDIADLQTDSSKGGNGSGAAAQSSPPLGPDSQPEADGRRRHLNPRRRAQQ